jgi:hypothetical protein
MRALLPIADGAKWQMEPRRELLLCHLQLRPQGADSRDPASAGKLRLRRWRTVGCQALIFATAELVTMSVSLVSRRNSVPMMKDITATPIGYHRPL